MPVLIGVLVLLFVALKDGYYAFGMLLIIFLFAAWIVFYYSAPECPNCKTRGTLRYLHQRIDGGPDRRYHNNPQICVKCQWRDNLD